MLRRCFTQGGKFMNIALSVIITLVLALLLVWGLGALARKYIRFKQNIIFFICEVIVVYFLIFFLVRHFLR